MDSGYADAWIWSSYGLVSVGNITVGNTALIVNSNARLTTTGLIVNSGGAIVTRSGSALTGNVTINSNGSWNVLGATTLTGNVTNAGTATIGGYTVSGIGTLTNSGTINGSDNLRAATIVNSGSISGTTYGVNATSPLTLTNSGTISGGTSAVLLGANGNTININPGATFTNGIDYNNTTGNRTAFGSGSYTIAVKNYTVAGNTISLSNGTTQVVMSNNGNTVYSADGSARAPSTTIAVVNASGSAKAVSNQTQEFGHSVSVVVTDMLTQVHSGAGLTGGDSGGSFSGAQPAVLNYLDDAGPFANTRNPFANQPVMPAQGVVVDGEGNTVWSRAFAGARYQPSMSGLPATQAYYAGAVMGYDRRFEDWRIGGFAGYGSAAQYSSNGAGDVKGDVYFGGLYGRREIGPWAFDLGLTGGSINNKSVRYINGSTSFETAKADFDGMFVAPETALSYAYRIDPAWTLTPTARLRYTGSFYGGYSEAGSSQNISYGAQSVHILEERAELRLGHTLKLDEGSALNSYVQASVFDTQRLGDNVATASVLGTNIALNNATSSDLVGASLGAGFDWKVKKNITLFAGADGLVYSNHSYGVNSRAGFRIGF